MSSQQTRAWAACDSLNVDTTQEAADAEFERLKARVINEKAASEAHPGLLDKIAEHKKLVIACSAALGVLVLVVVLIAARSFIRAQATNLRMSVASTYAELVGKVYPPDSDIQKELDPKLANLRDSSIQATVENGVVTLFGNCPSQWPSVQAASTAWQIKGVRQVKNLVEVQPPVGVEATLPKRRSKIRK